MSNRKHKSRKPYRPYVGEAYKAVFLAIAAELNKTALVEFDDLDALRHCGFEMWKRVFPNKPFPADADVLRKRYYKDVEITVQSG